MAIVAGVLILLSIRHDVAVHDIAQSSFFVDLLPVEPDVRAREALPAPTSNEGSTGRRVLIEAPAQAVTVDSVSSPDAINAPVRDEVPTVSAPVASPALAALALPPYSNGAGRSATPAAAETRGGGTGSRAGSGEGSGRFDTSALTDVHWVHEPTAADLAPHNPRRARENFWSGSAVLACQVTSERHVKNCRILSEDPDNVGFGKATLAASSRFRVYPPTKNGNVIPDAWVRIHITWVNKRPPSGIVSH